jgi:hypothetical protein
VERNTGSLVRDSKKGIVPYGTWAGGFIAVTFGLGFLIIAGVLGLYWVIPALFIGVIWTAATAHGFRHGWLK